MVSVMLHLFPASDDRVTVRPLIRPVVERPSVGRTGKGADAVIGELSQREGTAPIRVGAVSSGSPRVSGVTSPGDESGWEEFGSSHPVKRGSIVHRE